MKKLWPYVPLAALALAAFCLAFQHHIVERGYLHLVVTLLGLDFGITRAKAHNSLLWFGQAHTIPLDDILFWVAIVAICVAIAVTMTQVKFRRREA